MSEELKPCPFCGNKGRHVWNEGDRVDQVYCVACNAEVAGRPWRGGAVASWNKRTLHDREGLRDAIASHLGADIDQVEAILAEVEKRL